MLYALQSNETRSKLVSTIRKHPLTKRDIEEIQENTAKYEGLEKSQRIINELAKKSYLIIQKIDKNKKLEAFILASCIPYLEEEDYLRDILLEAPSSNNGNTLA